MHILPLILSAWSYKQHVTDAYLNSLDRSNQRRFGHAELPKLAVSSTGELSIVRGETGLMAPDEVEAIRNRARDFSAGPPRENPDGSNTRIGSYFGSNEITHNGTDAWESLKSRLLENGIYIEDDRVSELAAGFYAEHKMQEILGHSDKKRLRDELTSDYIDLDFKLRFDARWIREIQAHPDEEAIAEECYADLHKNFPKALGLVPVAGKAIGFDPNVVEVE